MSNIVSLDGSQFFEGIEKLMEIWFCRKDGNDDYCDMRKVPRFVILIRI